MCLLTKHNNQGRHPNGFGFGVFLGAGGCLFSCFLCPELHSETPPQNFIKRAGKERTNTIYGLTDMLLGEHSSISCLMANQ